MDGVTDAACRFIVDTYGKPDVIFTEFTSVEGIERGIPALLQAFIHHKTDTPTIGQIFGYTPQAFYKAAFVVCEMGFDGVDINMGCPDRAVARKGGGAALILRPKLAQDIIYTVKQAVKDWSEGKKLEDSELDEEIITYVRTFQNKMNIFPVRRLLPVSVKTRIGYDRITTEEWIRCLLEAEPFAISLHGRTLKQMYRGKANWEEIGKAAALAEKSNTSLLGNGDIHTYNDALGKIKMYKLNGVLIGRASFGNPWIFQNKTVPLETKLATALEHCHVFMNLTPDSHFLSLRKHLAWYCKGFDHAAHIRDRLMRVQNLKEVEEVLHSISS